MMGLRLGAGGDSAGVGCCLAQGYLALGYFEWIYSELRRTPVPLHSQLETQLDAYVCYWEQVPTAPPALVETQKQVAERFAALLASAEDPFVRTTFPGHFTASALIVTPDYSRTLLTHHRKLDRWLQLGGHADGDRQLLAVARREGHEESGLADLAPASTSLPELYDLDIHWIPPHKHEPGHFHYDARYLLVTSTPESIAISEESHALEWFTIDRAYQVTEGESFHRLLDKLRFVREERDCR